MKFTTFLSVIILALYVAGCNSKQIIDSQEVEKYTVFNPHKTDTLQSTDYIADISAKQNVEIRSRVKGILQVIHVDEGERVKKGQYLFSVSRTEYAHELVKAKATLKSAEANLQTEKLNLQNTENLYKNNIVSPLEVQSSKAKVAAALSAVEMAQAMVNAQELNLSFADIKAPFDGVINRLFIKEGSLVDESSLLTTISNDKSIYAYFNISESEYLSYIQEMELYSDELELVLTNGEIYQHKGKMEAIGGEIDRTTGNVFFRASFPNPDYLLKHGATGNVRIKRSLKDIILIPQKSTFEIQDKLYIYTIDEGNIIQMKQIEPSMRLSNMYVLESGLDPKDRIVFEGVQELKVGQNIQPVLTPLHTLLSILF